jgi:hypothetical protein
LLQQALPHVPLVLLLALVLQAQLAHLQSLHAVLSHAQPEHVPPLQPHTSHLQLSPQQQPSFLAVVAPPAVAPPEMAATPIAAVANSASADFINVERNMENLLKVRGSFAPRLNDGKHDCALSRRAGKARRRSHQINHTPRKAWMRRPP